MQFNQQALALLFCRLLLGLIFFWQGFGKIFTWGVQNVYSNVFSAYEETFLPIWLLKFTAYFTSYAELICGLFLILGLFRKQTYLILVSVLLIVALGHGIKDPIWSLDHVMFRAAPLFLLLWIPREKDIYSLDNRFFTK